MLMRAIKMLAIATGVVGAWGWGGLGGREARGDWVELFDAGFTQPWTFFVVDNTGKAPTTGTPFAGIVAGSVGGAALRLSHSTVANNGAGGGAAAAVGIVDLVFINGTVRATLNANPGDGQKSLLAVFARGSSTTGRAYIFGIDFRTGTLVLQRADTLAGQAVTLASAPIPGFSAGKRYFVELSADGSALAGRVAVAGNVATLATLTATETTIAGGRAGVLVRTGYSMSGTPLDPIVGTFDDVSVTNSDGGGGGGGGGNVPAPLTGAQPVIATTGILAKARFEDGLLETSLNNGSAARRLDFAVTGVIAGATVRLYANETLIAERAGGGGGRVVAPTNGTAALADGLYTVRASQIFNGVESAKIEALLLRVDTAAPGRPPAPDLTEASDTGVSNSDNVTGAAEFVVEGTSEPGASIILLLNGRSTRIPFEVADADGRWRFTAPSGKGGVFPLSVVAIDRAGNVSQVSEATVVRAITRAPKAPSGLALGVADRAPAPRGVKKNTFTRNATPTITGKGVSGATVRLTIAGSGADFGTGVVGADKKWSITLTRALVAGEQFLGATQMDQVGNESLPSKVFKVVFEAVGGGALGARGVGGADDAREDDEAGGMEDVGGVVMSAARADFDGDGAVTLDDARLLMAWIGRGGFPVEFDVDEDGDVDADDLWSVMVFVGR